MREWHFLPDRDGHHYYLRVTDIYRDDAIFVEYEIYRDEENQPIQIDFFEDEIKAIIKEVKEDYRNQEKYDF